MRLLLYIMPLLLSMSTVAQSDIERRHIEQRIKPVGKVYVEQSSPPMHALNDKPVVDAQAGKTTYEQFCSVCHQSGLAGAPIFRDEKSWKARLSNKDLDALVASAIKGLNAMPIKGTCTSCSEDDLKNAIQYMLPKS